MTNLEKMQELSGHNADKETVMSWAYHNRVWVIDLPGEEPFESMKASVEDFFNREYTADEDVNWDRFLDAEFVENRG